MMLRGFLLSVALLVCLTTASCIGRSHSPVGQVMYDPPLAKHAGRVVEGQTTATQIGEWFGTPYLQADGPQVTVFAGSPLMRSLRDPRVQELADEYSRLIPYSSLDDDHVVLLYMEMAVGGLESLMYGDGEIRPVANTMFVMIDKQTGLVEEFCYREQFKPN
jgi:hypothetical protein